MAIEAFWTEYDPLNDCTVTESGGVLSIAIPSGTNHDLWVTPQNNACRLIQPANNVDFTIETKITSDSGASAGKACGLVVQADSETWVRFSLHHDGSVYKIFCATLASGSTNTRFNTTHTPTFPFWLRLTRSGNDWSCYKSTDGTNFTQQSTTFSFTMTVQNCGIFAATSVSNPAWTATFDSFIADGIQNIQTADHIEVGIIDSFFSATATYALSNADTVNRSDVYSASVEAAVPTDLDFSDTMTISDRYSASVSRQDQLAWVSKTRQVTNWTVK